jgi:hypothetical protein
MGSTTPGTVWTTAGSGSKRVSAFSFAAPAAVDVIRLRAYVDGKGASSGSQTVRGIVYADSGGAPGARLGSTGQITINAGRSPGWVDLYLSSAVRLNAGRHWLGLHTGSSGGVVRYAAGSRTDALRFNSDSYSDGPSSAFGSAKVDAKEMSIHAIGR